MKCNFTIIILHIHSYIMEIKKDNNSNSRALNTTELLNIQLTLFKQKLELEVAELELVCF